MEAWLEALLGRENLLVLAPRPADVGGRFAPLLDAALRLGRPPMLVALGDGTAGAAEPDAAATCEAREAEAAAAQLGLKPDALLLAGFHAGTLPLAGPAFARSVGNLFLLLWRHDCTLVAAPGEREGDAAATQAIAAALAARAGTPLLLQEAAGWRLLGQAAGEST